MKIILNEVIEYDITNEEPARFKKKVIIIRIIDKIRYQLISINQYKRFSERNITENIKIFLQLYMIMTDLLTCHQDLVRGGCY